MTIYLPNELTAFRSAFDQAFTRILGSKQDQVFYSLLAALLKALRMHPLIGSHVLNFEEIDVKANLEFSAAAFEAMREEWHLLWKMHPHSWKIRCELVRLKNMIIRPRHASSNSLFHQMNFSLLHLRAHPLFCDRLERISLFFHRIHSERIRKMRCAYQIGKFKKTKNEFQEIKPFLKWPNFLPILTGNVSRVSRSLDNRCNHIDEYLMCWKRKNLILKTSIQGNDDFQKGRTMQAAAEIDPVFCWNRMKLFLDCWHLDAKIPLPQFLQGSWENIGLKAWGLIWNTYDKMVLWHAQMDLADRLAAPNSPPSFFLKREHQILRKDYEGFLSALRQHLWNHLVQLEQTIATQKIEMELNNSLLDLPGTQKRSFAIDLAIKCWKQNPTAKYREAYEYYLLNCPLNRRLAYSTWERIISKAKIDLRPKNSKVRGQGKKTLQKRLTA